MNPSIPKDGNALVGVPENSLDENEIELAKKASRAFAVSYVNEIYNTVKSMDPSVIKEIKVTKLYPYYLYVFIYQEKPGIIKQLDLYTERKSNGDGLCEVREIHHSTCPWDPSIKDRTKILADNGVNWTWTFLEISEMYVLAISKGRRVGRSIYSRHASAPILVPVKHHLPTSISVIQHL